MKKKITRTFHEMLPSPHILSAAIYDIFVQMDRSSPNQKTQNSFEIHQPNPCSHQVSHTITLLLDDGQKKIFKFILQKI